MEVEAQSREAGCCTVSADRLRRTCCSLCVATVVFLLLLAVYLHQPGLFKGVTPEPFVHKDNSTVTLLMWTYPFGQYSELPDCSALYQIDGCKITVDRRAYPQADAVVVHHRDVQSVNVKLPSEPRPRAQKWIWMNSESPTHTFIALRLEHIFNLTMSYRIDSDIFVPYGYLVPSPPTSRSHPLRSLFVAWVVSNWSKNHARVAFYNQLRQYIQVDVFGNAGRPVPEVSSRGRSRSSVVRLVQRYQFYLALENSQHTDYITEKLWNALRAGAVPVVLGPSRQNYERFLPPQAFIHVNDFPTVRGLARYLLMLWGNPTLLKRHLDWSGSYTVYQPSFWDEHVCTACRAVRTSRGRTDVVKNLKAWFYS